MFKHLWLGLTLILLVSGILLFSDLRRREPGQGRVPRVALFQYSSRPILDDGVQGVLDVLAGHGLVDGRTISIQKFNAENDMPTANSIARGIVGGGFDMVVTVSTPCLQVMASANREGKVIHVFGLVTDPFGSGVGLDRGKPAEHPRHLIGFGTFQPVRDALLLARRTYPSLKRIGLVWNPSEACSEACTRVARKTCAELGVELMEAQVENSTAVGEAASSLVSRGVQALFIGGDNTVEMSMKSVVKAGERGRIPTIGCAPSHIHAGALIGLGADYYEVGRAIGEVASEILRGRDPATYRIGDVLPKKLGINMTIPPRLREPWKFPPDMVSSAVMGIDEKGQRWDRSAKPAAAAKAVTKKWRIHLIELVNAPSIDESREGIQKGLQEAGLVEGRDYELKIRNAQGDLPTLNSLVDAAITEQADMVYTITTPALQTAMMKIRDRPLLFALALDPLLVGDTGTHEAHRPNVAGIYDRSPFEEMMKLIRVCLPRARSIGTLFAPSEVNSVNFRDELAKSARAAGLKLVALASNSSSEANDAALALTQKRVDAICQINDNLHGAAFPSIVAAARRARLPIFAFSTGQANQGAAVVLSNDHFDGGRESALMAAEVMRGKSPAEIPYRGMARTRLLVNRAAAAEAGLNIPDEVLRQVR